MDVTDHKERIDQLAAAIRNNAACVQYANNHDDPEPILKLTPVLLGKTHEIETLAAQLVGEQSKRKEPLLCSHPPEKSSLPSSSSQQWPPSESLPPAVPG